MKEEIRDAMKERREIMKEMRKVMKEGRKLMKEKEKESCVKWLCRILMERKIMKEKRKDEGKLQKKKIVTTRKEFINH